jgi:hypothetical protein
VWWRRLHQGSEKHLDNTPADADGGPVLPPVHAFATANQVRSSTTGLVELEPAAGGSYAGRPPFDLGHGELVSTVGDYTRFAPMLADGGRFQGRQVVSEGHLRLMTSDQVPAVAKTPDSFFPGFGTGPAGASASLSTPTPTPGAGGPAATGGPAGWAPTSSSTLTAP